MFVGALLLCASVTDVSSCDVKMNMKDFYDTKEECALEMFEVAKYTANALRVATKPFCFKIEVYST
tara:strand:+ start:4984 stop:5181 length:198 start_codon:yes stop_codon:yes gene_type:complete